MMKRFLQTDLVGANTLNKVDACLAELRKYIAGFPSVLKLSITLIGSYSSGFASRSGSMVDLLVRMDGGTLTASLDSDQLALALAAGLKDWAYLATLTPLGNDSGTLICETRDDASIILRIRACNIENFPVSYFFHSKLFSAYSTLDPKIVLLVSGLKHWARTSGFSSPVPFSSCPLSGFHWTIIALVFLTETNLVANLHQMGQNPSRRIQYGPNVSDSFSLGPNDRNSKLRNLMNIEKVFHLFFEWLGNTDLLARSICLNPAVSPHFSKGWIYIMDPCIASNGANTVDTSGSQKEQVVFAMKLQREAKLMATLVKEAKDISDLIYAKKISMLSNGDGPVHKMDVAV